MEIVARAYDQDKKKIIENIQLPEHGGYFTSIGGYLLDPRFVVNQWSGKLDKNGSKIFSDDIIEIENESALKIGSTRVRALVGFQDGCFMYTSGKDRTNFDTLLYPVAPNCKVIGNRFLNEPLLWIQATIKKPRKKRSPNGQKRKKVGRPKKTS